MLQVGERRSFLRHLVSKAWNIFSESASRVHISQPLERMEVTRDLQSLNLLAKLMVLHHQILFSLAIVAVAEAILMQTSAEHVPSLHKVASRYLKLGTSSKVWLFMPESALLLFMLLVMILLFSVLTTIPHAIALSTSLLVRS